MLIYLGTMCFKSLYMIMDIQSITTDRSTVRSHLVIEQLGRWRATYTLDIGL